MLSGSNAATWKVPADGPAGEEYHPLNMQVNESSDDLNLWSWCQEKQRWIVPTRPCPNCTLVIKTNIVIALSHEVLGWFVPWLWITVCMRNYEKVSGKEHKQLGVLFCKLRMEKGASARSRTCEKPNNTTWSNPSEPTKTWGCIAWQLEWRLDVSPPLPLSQALLFMGHLYNYASETELGILVFILEAMENQVKGQQNDSYHLSSEVPKRLPIATIQRFQVPFQSGKWSQKVSLPFFQYLSSIKVEIISTYR